MKKQRGYQTYSEERYSEEREYIMLTRKNGMRTISSNIQDVEVREEIERSASEFDIEDKEQPLIFLLPLKRKKQYFLLGEAHYIESSKYEKRQHHFVHAVLIQEEELEDYIPEFQESLDRRFFQGTIEQLETMEKEEIQHLFDNCENEGKICSNEETTQEKLNFMLYIQKRLKHEEIVSRYWNYPRRTAQLVLELFPTWCFRKYGLIVNGENRNLGNRFRLLFLKNGENEPEKYSIIQNAGKQYHSFFQVLGMPYEERRACYAQMAKLVPYMNTQETIGIEQLEQAAFYFFQKQRSLQLGKKELDTKTVAKKESHANKESPIKTEESKTDFDIENEEEHIPKIIAPKSFTGKDGRQDSLYSSYAAYPSYQACQVSQNREIEETFRKEEEKENYEEALESLKRVLEGKESSTVKIDQLHAEIKRLTEIEKSEFKNTLIDLVGSSKKIDYNNIAYLVLFLFEYDALDLHTKMQEEEFRVWSPYDIYAMERFLYKLSPKKARRLQQKIRNLFLEEIFGKEDHQAINRKVKFRIKFKA